MSELSIIGCPKADRPRPTDMPAARAGEPGLDGFGNHQMVALLALRVEVARRRRAEREGRGVTAELTWHAQQADVRERLDCPKDGGPPFLQHEVARDAELFWRGGPDPFDPPLSAVLKYERRGAECGECSMYRFVGAFPSLEAAREVDG